MAGKSKPSLVDRHADRTAIEAQLARNVPLRRLSSRYGIGISVLSRHRDRLRKKTPKTFEALQARSWNVTPEELHRIRAETADGWISTMRSQVDKLVGGQDAALEDERFASAAQLAGQAHVAMKMLGEAVGVLSDAGIRLNVTTNTTIRYTSEFHELRNTILGALRRHPEALRDVLAALRAEDGEEGEGGVPPDAPPLLIEAEAI